MIERIIRRRGMIVCCAVFLLMATSSGFGQGGIDTLRRDTTRVDSLRADSLDVIASDSLPTYTPSPPLPYPLSAPLLGSLATRNGSAGEIFVTKRHLAWRRYFTLFDALSASVPAQPLSQGAPGLVRSFGYAGASPGATGYFFNGRQLYSASHNGFDPEFFPVEFLERAEILRGAKAAVVGDGESLMAINLVQPRYDVDGSYIRLWYMQGANDMTGADATYARNIGDRVNLTVGFRRIPSDGEWDNQELSNSAIRGALTWYPASNLALSISELYVNSTRGQNGGLSPTSVLDPFNEEVINLDWKENTLRHDATLSLRWFPGRADDSVGSDSVALAARGLQLENAFGVDASLYYTFEEWDVSSFGAPLLIDTFGTEATRAVGLVGARGALGIPLGGGLRVDAHAAADMIDDSRGTPSDKLVFRHIEAGALVTIPAGEVLELRGGGRIVLFDGGNMLQMLVGEGVIALADALSVRLTGRIQNRSCNCSRPDLSANYRALDELYTTVLAEGAVEWRDSAAALSVGGYLRKTDRDPGVPVGRLEPQTIIGADLRGRTPILFPFITLEAKVLGTLLPEGDRRLPAVYALGDLHGSWKLFQGNLDLRVGTSLEYQTPLQGSEYDVLGRRVAFVSDATRATFAPFPTWNAYVHGRIGQAYVRIAFENILSVENWTLYRYPVWPRSLVLGVTWSLVD